MLHLVKSADINASLITPSWQGLILALPHVLLFFSLFWIEFYKQHGIEAKLNSE